MKLFYILFFASTLFYTEGSLAQGVFDPKDIKPPVSIADSLDENDDDVIERDENDDFVPQRRRVSPYSEAQKQYLAQPLESKNIQKSNWERAKEGLDYSTDKMKKNKKKDKDKDEENGYGQGGQRQSNREEEGRSIALSSMWLGLFGILKWVLIIGAIVLLAYLILRFVGEGNIFGSRKRSISDPSVQIDLEHIEENLETAELDPLIRKAIADKNYTLAVRLYYLAILKELHLKGAIDWKKDKTNRTYVREMRESPFFEPFRNTTAVFERVWYGSQTIDERGFELVQPDFQSLLKRIQ
jgi:Domain of unknown function (DUF4129)